MNEVNEIMTERPKPERWLKTAFVPTMKVNTVEAMDKRVKSKTTVIGYAYVSWMILEVNVTRKWIDIEAVEQPKASESKAKKNRNEVLLLKIAMPSMEIHLALRWLRRM